MRVLLDEMLPRKLKRLLSVGVEVVTVRERGWDSKRTESCWPSPKESSMSC